MNTISRSTPSSSSSFSTFKVLVECSLLSRFAPLHTLVIQKFLARVVLQISAARVVLADFAGVTLQLQFLQAFVSD
jgi:hypothetical protein